MWFVKIDKINEDYLGNPLIPLTTGKREIFKKWIKLPPRNCQSQLAGKRTFVSF